MSKTIKNIPKLRFPEFRDAPAWEEKKLGEISTYVDYRGRAPIKTEIGYFLVTAKNIKKGFIDYNCSKEYVAEDDYLNVMSKGLPEIGDILFTTEAPLGNVALVDNKNIALAQRVIKFRNKEMLSNIYLLQYMLSDVFQKAIFCKSIGSTVQGISGKELQQIKLLIPSLKEQQKIAECLSSLDALILAHSGKVEALKAHKKALMQQLFPTEGETTPRLRFPEFQNAPAWEEKKLYELNIYISDGNYGEMYPKSEEMKSSGIPFIRANNIKEQKLVWDDMKYIDAALHDKLTSGHLKKDDILVTTRGEIGTIAYVTNEFEGANINAQICLLRCDESLNSFFIMQYLASNNGSRQFRELETGSALKQLPKKNLGKVKVSISPLLSEQQKIADCLSSIDELITAQSAKVEALKQHKKALMQQLFPTCKVTS